ncbi:MAG: DegT/DnrJ/EryC1/StrS family aminotransferase [Cyclobacteriaceae bacterium]|jgi:pyridoxal phosphate-dependent aminotransferase EpsN
MRPFIPLSAHELAIGRLNDFQAEHALTAPQALVQFERAVASKTGAAHAVAVSSGTAAIHLALKLAGVKPGDLVLAPTFTYVATINPIRYLGAEPVFIDSEETTWNIDPNLLEQGIKSSRAEGKNPTACLVVNTYGTPGQWKEIRSLCQQFEIPLIEDAAESLGATVESESSGSLGDIGITSFNNNKVVTCFGGGAVLTKTKAQADQVLYWATQARTDLPYYEHREVGFNYRMSSLQALWGLLEWPELDERVTKRRAIFQRYRESLADWVTSVQYEQPGTRSNRWLSALGLTGEQALALQPQLQRAGIESRPLWNPMHRQPAFEGARAHLSGVSERLFRSGICLPSGHMLSDEDQQRVIQAVKLFFAR